MAPRNHADDHRPGGPDPIPALRGVLRFNVDNQGGYVAIQTNDTVDLDALPDPCAVGGEWGWALEDASGAGIVFASTDVIRLKAGTTVSIEGVTLVQIIVGGKQFTFGADGDVHIPTGGSVIADT